MSNALSALATKFLSLMGVANEPEPPPPPKTEAEFNAAMRRVVPAVETVRGIDAVNDRATTAKAAMETKMGEAIDAAGRQDFDAGIAALAVAEAQTEIVSDERVKMREAFFARQEKLGAKLADITGRVGKLASPAAPVTQALKTATGAEATATTVGEAEPENWPAATTAMNDLEKAINDVDAACLADADSKSTAFGVRFDAKKASPPAGAASMKARTAYLAEQKKLAALISKKDGLGALELCPAVAAALADYEAKATPSGTDKAQIASDAVLAATGLSDTDLAAKSMTEKAELAFNLCANGRPSSGPALAQLCRVYRASPPAAEFTAKRDEERTKIAEKVAKIPGLSKVFDNKGKVKQSEWDKVIADPAKVQALLQEVSTAQTEVLGLPPVAVTTYDTPSSGGTISMGGCVWTAGPPTIKLNANRAAVGNAKEALISILHETYHAEQDILVKKLMSGDLGPSDPLYAQVLMFAANKPGIGYLPPSVSQPEYEAQPVEIDAEVQGTTTANSVLLAIKGKKSSWW